MTSEMRTVIALSALSALSGLVVLGAAAPSDAAPKRAGKSAPACGARVLPLVEGNSWTYVAVPAPDPILPELAKIAPRAAQEIVITVKAVEAKGTETVVRLEEKIRYEIVPENREAKKPAVTSDVVVESSITCSKTKFEVSPNSFFFSAEPGGMRGVVLDKVERSKDTSLKLTKGMIGDQQWREDIVAQFTRTPVKTSHAKLSPGKLELERLFTPEPSEMVITPKGQQFPKAERLALVTTGRVTFDEPLSPDPKSSELPANWISKFWFEPDVGMVQALNMYAHMYQLSDYDLK
jgi:hypothetical protein